MTKTSPGDPIDGPDNRAVSPPLPLPRPGREPFPTYKGPAFVEIKPHSVERIKTGIKELADELAERKKRNWTGDYYLLTYHYRSVPTRNKSEFTGYLLKPNATAFADAEEFAKARRADKNFRLQSMSKPAEQAWLRSLGEWWPLGTHPVPELTFGRWREVAGAPAIGSLLEYPLREKFVQMHGVKPEKHKTRDKMSSGRGRDIDLLEVAEFLYELEAALARAA